MFRTKSLWILGLVAALAIAPAFAERVIFKPIEGGEFMVPGDMTADGETVLLSGLFGGIAWTWTEDGGIVELGVTGCGSGQFRMSDDGSTIVGNAKNADGKCEAAKYLGAQNWQTMGSEPGALPCGSSVSTAYDTNDDMAVGLFWRAQLCKAIGGTWDVVAGVAGPELTSTVPNRPTRGNGVTADGSTVVGWQDQPSGFRSAAKWVNGVQEFILDNSGGLVGEAIASNSDASAIVGTGWQGDVGGTGQGWLWRAGQGMEPMAVGGIGTNIQSVPIAVSEDGNTVVGLSRDFGNGIQRGWIWTQKGGFEWLDDFLKGQRAAGWTILGGSAMSADGKRIGGYGVDPNGTIRAFIIDLGSKGKQ